MDNVRFLEWMSGGRWCGVKFGPSADPTRRPAERPMHFCEAVAESRRGPVTVTAEWMECPGGRRCLGWTDDDEALIRSLARKSGLEIRVAREVIRDTPRLDRTIREVTVGTYDDPDVALSYAQPEATMELLRSWQRIHGRPLGLHASGFMSVCGAVAVKAYLTGEVCISFGCPDAREHGGIGRDRLVIGVPISVAERLRTAARTATAAEAAIASP